MIKKGQKNYIICSFAALFLAFFPTGCNETDNINKKRQESHSRPTSVGAYYYKWYHLNKWKTEGASHKPSSGYYDSNDIKIISQHMRWAQEASIGFFFVSWMGINSSKLDEELTPLEQPAKNENISLAVLYDTAVALGEDPEKIDLDLNFGKGIQFVEDIESVAYSTSNTILTVNECPVVMIYLTRNLINAEKAFKLLQKKLAENNKCIHLIADIVWWNTVNQPLVHTDKTSKDQWNWLLENFNGITGYNMYSDHTIYYGLPKEDSKIVNEITFISAVIDEYLKWFNMTENIGLIFHPGILPGYDDRPLRGGMRPAMHRSQEFYEKFWSSIYQFKRPGSWVLLTSFNEWHEGTEIEPSLEFGTQYIKMTKKHANEFNKN